MYESAKSIHEHLEHHFLYNHDASSMHLLLSLVSQEHVLTHLKARYFVSERVFRAMRRALSGRADRHHIMRALQQLLLDAIHRIELAFVVDAYCAGREQEAWIDAVERLALKEYDHKELQSLDMLYHDADRGMAMGIQSRLFFALKEETDGFFELHEWIRVYGARVIKPQIYQINRHLDRQLVLCFDSDTLIQEEEGALTMSMIRRLYYCCLRYMGNHLVRAYKQALWEGINDAVLERYRR